MPEGEVHPAMRQPEPMEAPKTLEEVVARAALQNPEIYQKAINKELAYDPKLGVSPETYLAMKQYDSDTDRMKALAAISNAEATKTLNPAEVRLLKSKANAYDTLVNYRNARIKGEVPAVVKQAANLVDNLLGTWEQLSKKYMTREQAEKIYAQMQEPLSAVQNFIRENQETSNPLTNPTIGPTIKNAQPLSIEDWDNLTPEDAVNVLDSLISEADKLEE
jgi:hypothetical protein